MLNGKEIHNFAASIGIDRIGWFASRVFPDYLEALAARPEYDFLYRDHLAFEEAGRLAGQWSTIVVIVADYFVERAGASTGYHLSNYSRFCWNTLNPLARQVMDFLSVHDYHSELVNAPARVAACVAGLGTIGKNCMFFVEGLGSYVGIHTIGTDWNEDKRTGGLELVTDPHCLGCQRCIRACPVGAIYPEGYRIDPLRCISFLNRHAEETYKKFPPDPKMLHGWVHGCETCQEVCSINMEANHTRRAVVPVELDIYGVRIPGTAAVDDQTLRQGLLTTTCPGYAEYIRMICS